jgi:general stress protein YciG
MDPEKQREIASKGGKASHRGASGGHAKESDDDDRHIHLEGEEHGRQGFASMDEETKHRIQSMGGKASHGAKHDSSAEHHEHGRQGFASMDEETKHRVQSMGGKASHGAGGSHTTKDSSSKTS